MRWSINNRKGEIQRKRRYIWTRSHTKHNCPSWTEYKLIYLCLNNLSSSLRMFITCTARSLNNQFTQTQKITCTVCWRCTDEYHICFHYVQRLWIKCLYLQTKTVVYFILFCIQCLCGIYCDLSEYPEYLLWQTTSGAWAFNKSWTKIVMINELFWWNWTIWMFEPNIIFRISFLYLKDDYISFSNDHHVALASNPTNSTQLHQRWKRE